MCPDEPRTFEFLQTRPQPLLVLSDVVRPKSFMCKAFIRLVLQDVVRPEKRYRDFKAEVQRNLAPSRRRTNLTDADETVLDYIADVLAEQRRISDEAIFEEALKTLSPRDREIVLLRAHDEKVATIVRLHGLKKSQVYVIIDRFSRLCNELMDRAKRRRREGR